MEKFRFVRTVALVIFGSLLVACSSMQTKQIASKADSEKRGPANNAWSNYHWARTTPQFTLKVGDNMTSTWKTHLAAASADWNSPEAFGAASTPVLTAIVVGTSSAKRCQMVRGTTQVCNSRYGNNGWLGLASINISGEHITQGSAKMNDTYFGTATYNNPNEKLHVVCQELAHTFGLGHQSEDGSSQNSCMDYFSNTGANATSTISTRPNVHDFNQLAEIYNHADSSTTVAPYVLASAAANSSEDDITEDPNSWGQFMKNESRGQSAYYERINRNGSKTLTHVFWTLEAAKRCRDCDHRDHQN